MIELNGFDYQYLPGIILSENDSLLLDISAFPLQGVIPLIVAFITSIVAYSIAAKKIKMSNPMESFILAFAIVFNAFILLQQPPI